MTMLCDLAFLTTSLLAALLLNAARELRLRRSLEYSLGEMREENQKMAQANTTLEANMSTLQATNTTLKETSASLQGDLTMLKETIGLVGEMSGAWLEQLRQLHLQHKRENDRQALMLKGHARIIMLQLIQHFDVNGDLKLDADELRAAEAFLLAGFPNVDISSLEAKASSSGVTLADLEPLVLRGLGTTPRPALIASAPAALLAESTMPAASTPARSSRRRSFGLPSCR